MLFSTVHQRTAWTDVGSVGVVRRLDLGESVAFSQISSHGHVSQVVRRGSHRSHKHNLGASHVVSHRLRFSPYALPLGLPTGLQHVHAVRACIRRSAAIRKQCASTLTVQSTVLTVTISERGRCAMCDMTHKAAPQDGSGRNEEDLQVVGHE